MRKAIMFFVIWSLSMTALSQDGAVLDYKGMPLGSDEAAIRAKISTLACRDMENSPAGDRLCSSSSETYAGVTAKTSLFFTKDKLTAVQISIAEADFSLVAGALRAKFGKTTFEEVGAVENKMGAKFENLMLMWRLGGGMITARQRFKEIDRSSVFIHLDAGAEEFSRRKKERTASGAKDI